MNTNDIILKLINSNATVNEICNLTGLSPKQLFYRINMLKLKGYDFEKKYYYDGEIVYKLIDKVVDVKKNEVTIITSPKDTEFRAVLISDLHAGNENETLNRLDDVYNFCVKNGYNIILNIGDLIDAYNVWGEVSRDKMSIEEQIDHLLDNYPYDKNIINFICLGNHDYDALSKEGINIHKILETKRHDLFSLGYSCGIINVKNEKIGLRHNIISVPRTKIKNLKDSILLTGHSHRFKSKVENNYGIYVPMFCNMGACGEPNLPSFLTLSIEFKNGYYDNFLVERYMFIDDKMYKIAVIEQPIKRSLKKETMIKNEEYRNKMQIQEYKKIQEELEKYKRDVKTLKKRKEIN